MNRTELRKTIIKDRDGLDQHKCLTKSRSIVKSLLEAGYLNEVKTIFCYVNFRSEVLTVELIRHCLDSNIQVAVPYTMTSRSRLHAVGIENLEIDLSPGSYGILEPKQELLEKNRVESEQIDMIIVPGSVFDRQGGRMGYGGGYYDRFLSNDAPGAIRIGLAYELQLVDKVPMESHDQFMDFVVTEQKIYRCR